MSEGTSLNVECPACKGGPVCTSGTHAACPEWVSVGVLPAQVRAGVARSYRHVGPAGHLLVVAELAFFGRRPGHPRSPTGDPVRSKCGWDCYSCGDCPYRLGWESEVFVEVRWSHGDLLSAAQGLGLSRRQLERVARSVRRGLEDCTQQWELIHDAVSEEVRRSAAQGEDHRG